MSKKLKPSERRRQRQEEKRERHEKDRLRLIEKISPDKEGAPRTAFLPHPNKTPRLSSDYNYREYAFGWSLDEADREGGWGWGENRDWTLEEEKDVIAASLGARENNTWEQVHAQTYNGANGRRKYLYREDIPLDHLHSEAQARWMEDELREAFPSPARFRAGTNRRIWGFRYKHSYYVVWYEREHQIYELY